MNPPPMSKLVPAFLFTSVMCPSVVGSKRAISPRHSSGGVRGRVLRRPVIASYMYLKVESKNKGVTVHAT